MTSCHKLTTGKAKCSKECFYSCPHATRILFLHSDTSGRQSSVDRAHVHPPGAPLVRKIPKRTEYKICRVVFFVRLYSVVLTEGTVVDPWCKTWEYLRYYVPASTGLSTEAWEEDGGCCHVTGSSYFVANPVTGV